MLIPSALCKASMDRSGFRRHIHGMSKLIRGLGGRMRHQRQPVKGATADAPLGNICSAFYINKMDNDITLRIRKKLFALCVVLGVKVFNNPTNPAQPATLNIVGNKVHRTKYSRATELNPQHKVVQWVVANDKTKDKTATWIQCMCLTMGQPEWVEEQMCIYSWSNPGYWQVWTDGRTLYTFPAAQRTVRARFVAQIERGDRARRPL